MKLKPLCDYPGCDGLHKPNKLTEKILRESERGENIEHNETLEDFWKSMGIDLSAEECPKKGTFLFCPKKGHF